MPPRPVIRRKNPKNNEPGNQPSQVLILAGIFAVIIVIAIILIMVI